MVAKLMVNSCWGKWTQRGNSLPSSRMFYAGSPDLEEFHAAVRDPTTVTHVDILVDNMCVQLRSRKLLEHSEPIIDTNIMIGILTTCQARCMMYRSYLSKLHPKQLLYMDTDSVLYITGPGQPKFNLGKFLGDLTDEFEDPERKCVEFIGGAPKAYGYKLVSTTDPSDVKTSIKCKGFNLKGGWFDPASARNLLTYDTVKKMIVKGGLEDNDDDDLLGEAIVGEDLTVHPRDASECEKLTVKLFGIQASRDSTLTSIHPTRSFRYNFDKRRVVASQADPWHIPTRPFGALEEDDATFDY